MSLPCSMSRMYADRVGRRLLQSIRDGLLVLVKQLAQPKALRQLDGTLDFSVREQKSEHIGDRGDSLDATIDEQDIILYPAAEGTGLGLSLCLQ